MAVIKIRWHVDELTNVLTLFNKQKVYRSTTGPDGTFTELTNVSTRVSLVAGVTDYLFDDTGGASSYYYRVTYYHSTSLLESAPSVSMRGDLAGYVTLADVRNEGYAETLVTDAAISRAAWMATTLIDRVTGQWFEPRRRTFRLDSKGGVDLFLNVPIIAVESISLAGISLARTRDTLLIYNRHLTEGLISPDDRNNPRISFATGIGKWSPAAPQSVLVDGYFGHTELGPDDAVGESGTVEQYPLSMGRTPALIKRAALLLTARLMWGMATGRGDEFLARTRVVSESTRDQSYSLQPLSAADAEFGITGDVEVDSILAMFAAPLSAGGV